MDKIAFDTNAFESSKILLYPKAKILYSAIVFMELMTACGDTKELKQYQQAYKTAEKENLLIAITEKDILEVGRIQFLLAQDRKNAKGNAPKRSSKIKQETAMDCLIAVSACR